MKNGTSRSGFTLVELLVVVAIIAILSGMAVMLVGSATEKAAATASMATQKQLTSQINAYVQLHNALLPDRFDSMIRSDYATAGGTYTALSTTNSVAVDPSSFMGCSPSVGNNGVQNINRGVDPSSFSGQNRTLTVKQLTTNDMTCLTQLGVTTLCDYVTSDMSYGRLAVVNRAIAPGGNAGICIIDPQSVAGQQLYNDFGVDLSSYPRDATSGELTTDGRNAALAKQIFYVVGIGTSSTMIGDRQVGLQEAPSSSVVSGGYYNRFAVVIKYAGMSSDRSAGIVGILDPRGRGASAARQAVNAIQ